MAQGGQFQSPISKTFKFCKLFQGGISFKGYLILFVKRMFFLTFISPKTLKEEVFILIFP